MRNVSWSLAMVIAIAAWAAGACTGVEGGAAASQAPVGNLRRNPGFEEGDGPGDRTPDGWTFEQRAAHKGRVQVVSAPVHGGGLSVKLVPNEKNRPWDIA